MNDSSLANKYRPKCFGDVVGQEAIITQLRGRIMRNKIPPAMMFYGPSGTGKTTLARLMALYMNCAGLVEEEPCGNCGSCKSMMRLIQDGSESPDVTELNVAMYGGIEAVRKLGDIAPLAPRFKYRVFILDEVHQITQAAFNAALKLFENAPPRTKFILVTTNPEKLGDTILGRSENKFALKQLQNSDVAKRLYRILKSEGVSLPDEFAKKACIEIAATADGDLRSAIGILDNVINYVVGSGGVEGVTDLVQQKIIDQASAGAPYQLVQRYVAALFSGSRAKTFLAIKLAENHEYFLRKVMETLHQVLYYWIDRNNLSDKDKFWMMKGVDTPDIDLGRAILSHSDDADRILDEYARALERIKSYVSDPISVVQLATLKTLRIMDKWRNKDAYMAALANK